MSYKNTQIRYIKYWRAYIKRNSRLKLFLKAFDQERKRNLQFKVINFLKYLMQLKKRIFQYKVRWMEKKKKMVKKGFFEAIKKWQLQLKSFAIITPGILDNFVYR